jgi:hypothetical protein
MHIRHAIKNGVIPDILYHYDKYGLLMKKIVLLMTSLIAVVPMVGMDPTTVLSLVQFQNPECSEQYAFTVENSSERFDLQQFCMNKTVDQETIDQWNGLASVLCEINPPSTTAIPKSSLPKLTARLQWKSKTSITSIITLNNGTGNPSEYQFDNPILGNILKYHPGIEINLSYNDRTVATLTVDEASIEYLLKNAEKGGVDEMPILRTGNSIPDENFYIIESIIEDEKGICIIHLKNGATKNVSTFLATRENLKSLAASQASFGYTKDNRIVFTLSELRTELVKLPANNHDNSPKNPINQKIHSFIKENPMLCGFIKKLFLPAMIMIIVFYVAHKKGYSHRFFY